MRGKFARLKFIQILEDTPFISYAAKKSGIAKATIYRWMKSDTDFRIAVNNALENGRRHLCDIAEMALVEKIKDKEMGAIKFYLQNNNDRYMPKRTLFVLPEAVKKKLKIGQTCKACGATKAPDMSYKELRQHVIDTSASLGFKIIDEEKDMFLDSDEQELKRPQVCKICGANKYARLTDEELAEQLKELEDMEKEE